MRSDETLALVDAAEQIETAIRVAEAERRLAVLQGDDELVQQELASLRAREADRNAADSAERQRQLWRHMRIGDVLAGQHANLVSAGFEAALIAYAMFVAGAVLDAQPDPVLAGSSYPAWLAQRVLADVLRIDPPATLAVTELVPTARGMVEVWRPLAPGD